MTSTTAQGKTHENRFTAVLTRNLGYMLAAKAVYTPVYVRGTGVSTKPKVVAGGANDLVDGTIDRIFLKLGCKVLLVQVTTTSGLSERRQKLRAVLPRLPLDHVDVLLAGWDNDGGHFRLFRPSADFLDEGWRMTTTDTHWPWEKPVETLVQEKLL